MKDLQHYFHPISIDDFKISEDKKCLGNIIQKYVDETTEINLSDIDIVIIGVPEIRGHEANKGCEQAPDAIRKYLYQLSMTSPLPRIFDLGNVIPGKKWSDTGVALNEIFTFFVEHNILPIILGGSQDITYNQYVGYVNNRKIINAIVLDSKFDFKDNTEEINAHSYLNALITKHPGYLFNLSHMGSQSCFVNADEVDLMRKLYFDHYRLGNVREDIVRNEVIFRSSDLLSIDVSAIRQSDAIGQINPSPNGLFGEEICQLMRYAGISDKISSVGIYEYNPTLDVRGQTAHLIAQMIWYFIDGYYHKLNEFPDEESRNYVIYHVKLSELDEELTFYQSKFSDRWWIKVVNPDKIKKEYLHHYIIPCSYADYQQALKDELPLRWWNAYKKLS